MRPFSRREKEAMKREYRTTIVSGKPARVTVIGRQFWWGVPKVLPVIPGFEVIARPAHWMVARNREGKDYLFVEHQTYWGLYRYEDNKVTEECLKVEKEKTP
jgi:hypothetical protein